MTHGLSIDEAEQYDRQIRLWGLEAQKRLRTSAVLVVGARGLGAELCKNIVLAGVRTVTLLDDGCLTASTLGSRFLGRTNGVNRAVQAVEQLQALNPNVTVSVDTDSIGEKEDTFFTQFNAVCVTGCSLSSLLHINTVCRANRIKFFCGDVWGFYGYFFSDLGEHEYTIEVLEEDREAVDVDGPPVQRQQLQQEHQRTSVMKVCTFPSLKEAMAVSWSSKPARYFKRTPPTWLIIQTLQHFRDSNNGRDPEGNRDKDDLLSSRAMVAAKMGVDCSLIPENIFMLCFCELSPVCAIVGGVLGQEVIKALSGKDEPYQNCFLYDGMNSTGFVEALGV